MYTPQEIEKKRLEALAKKQERAKQFGNSENSKKPNALSNYFQKPSGVTQNLSTSNVKTNFKNKWESPLKKSNSQNRYNPVPSKNFYNKKEAKKVIHEIQCSMISDDRFSVLHSVYNTKLIDLFKTFSSRHYDPVSKIWDFEIKEYNFIKEKIIDLCKTEQELKFIPIPNYVSKTFENLSNEQKEKKIINLTSIDEKLLSSLYPFQKEGIEYGISKNGKCLIADDMGLGKTRQALGIARYYRNDWPLIIISPSSVRYQWSEAIIENLPSVPVQSIQHITTTKDYIDKTPITIISYDLLGRREDEITAQKFGVVICDESHYLKSGKTQRTKAVQRLCRNSSRIILLTGTPALSRPIELYPQIRLLLPNFMEYNDFGFRYCAGFKTEWGVNFSGSSNLKELELLLRKTCLIRRLKKNVLKQLPSKIRQKIILDPATIKTTKEMLAASDNLNKNLKSHSALLEYYSTTSKVKEKAVCNYVSDLVENEQKFIIFSHHQNMLDAICKLLQSKKISFIRIDGKTSAEQRKNYVDSFQTKDNILVAVLSIMAANAGITLTAASLVIFAELSWNPGILAQAEDRVHRIGQTDSVVIRYLLAKGTADDHLWPGIQKKIDVLNKVGLEQNMDLNQADVASKNVNSTLDSFLNTSVNENLKETLNNDDDDMFEEINLDNFT